MKTVSATLIEMVGHRLNWGTGFSASRLNEELDVAKKLGQRKTVFAWWPIHRIVRCGPFFRRDGHYWFVRVVLMWTLHGWMAYADENGG